MLALNTIENEIGFPQELRTNLRIEDPVEAAQKLANATDVEELLDVVNVDVKVGRCVVNLLKPLTKTIVQGHIQWMENRVHPKFFDLERAELPAYDPEVT